jgi:hypothetical protein
VRLLQVPSAVYESARLDPRRFVVAEGHERPGLERVVVADGACRVVLARSGPDAVPAAGPAV